MATLYATKGGNANSDLYTVDPATGALTSIGPIGFAVTGLAIDPTDGTFYGSTSNASPSNPRSLITIDPATGTGTLVGANGLSSGTALADLAFTDDGSLWAWGSNGARFYSVDKTTGAATLVLWNSGVSGEGYGGGLSVTSGGVMYHVRHDAGELFTVDPATGISTGTGLFVEPVVTPGVFPFGAGSFDSSDLMWLVGNANSLDDTVWLFTLDITTGALVNIGSTGPGSSGAPTVDALAWSIEAGGGGDGATFTKIKFGDGLSVTDEGGGVIRVDAGGGGGDGEDLVGIQFDTYPQAGGWLYVETTGTRPSESGIELRDSKAVNDSEAGIRLESEHRSIALKAEEGVGIYSGTVTFLAGNDDHNQIWVCDDDGYPNTGIRIYSQSPWGINLVSTEAGIGLISGFIDLQTGTGSAGIPSGGGQIRLITGNSSTLTFSVADSSQIDSMLGPGSRWTLWASPGVFTGPDFKILEIDYASGYATPTYHIKSGATWVADL